MSASDGVEETATPEATEAVGARLARKLGPGDIVVVSGDVGSGKTTLIRGALRALGVEGPVVSPTFTIGRRYTGAGAVALSHLDLYRLSGLESEDPGMLDDYLGDDTIAFIEWPEAVEPQLEGRLTRVRLRHAGGDRRLIELD